MKKYLRHIFMDGINGMAIGIFATFVCGKFMQLLSFYLRTPLDTIFYNTGEIFCVLTCAGIGIGIAQKFGSNIWIVLSAGICGMVGGYAANILNGSLFLDGSLIFSSYGNPISAFFSSCLGIELANLAGKKFKPNFFLSPLITIGTGSLFGFYLGPKLGWLTGHFINWIQWATEQHPLIMGLVISVLMAIASVLPMFAFMFATSLELTGLAAGAAAVGCCCAMFGFALSSYRENKILGLFGQGFGTAAFQLANTLHNPLIWVPVILTSAILGPLSVFLGMMNSTFTAGLGCLGIGCSLSAWEVMTQLPDARPILVLIKIFLMHSFLPGLLTLVISEWMRQKKWIDPDDMKIDY